MPTLTRWMIRASLLWLAAGVLLQLALSLRWPSPPWLSALSPFAIHIFTLGWLTQLIFGMVYWMFPKASLERPRGSPSLGWIAFVGLNAGLVLRGFGEAGLVPAPSGTWGWALPLAATLHWIAGMAFIANTWGRVRER